MRDFITLQKTCADSPNSWSLDAACIDAATFDLSAKNPDRGEVTTHLSSQGIMDETTSLDDESAGVLADIRALL